MRILIIYDSLYGNTERIAQAIGDTLKAQADVEVVRVGEANPGLLHAVDLLIVGSPTQQFRSTAAMREFLSKLPQNSLRGIKVAAFDTRLTQAEIDKSPALPFFVRLYGYAAPRISKKLKQKGGDLLLPGEGFYVEGMKGPLVAGELERAANWAVKLFA